MYKSVSTTWAPFITVGFMKAASLQIFNLWKGHPFTLGSLHILWNDLSWRRREGEDILQLYVLSYLHVFPSVFLNKKDARFLVSHGFGFLEMLSETALNWQLLWTVNNATLQILISKKDNKFLKFTVWIFIQICFIWILLNHQNNLQNDIDLYIHVVVQ